MNYNTQDYSSCLFRIPQKGGRVLWEITNSCNYSCSYCIFSSSPRKLNGELSTNDVYKVLTELKQEGFTHIKFTGGEPFIRKDLIDILTRATELDFISDLSTNASAINEVNARKLNQVNLSMVHVSLDGHKKEIQEKIRGENTYQRTIDGIKNLKRFTSHYLRIGTVLYEGNERYIEDMIRFYENLGVNEVIFSRMEPIGRMEGNTSLNATRSDDELEKEIGGLSQAYSKKIKINSSFNGRSIDCSQGKCPAVDRFIFIDNLGRVSPCAWIVEKDSKFKSVLTLRKNSLSEILNSHPIQRYLNLVQESEKKGTLGCPARRLEKILEN